MNETNPVPTAQAFSKGWLRPASRKIGCRLRCKATGFPRPAGYGNLPAAHLILSIPKTPKDRKMAIVRIEIYRNGTWTMRSEGEADVTAEQVLASLPSYCVQYAHQAFLDGNYIGQCYPKGRVK